jgi:hypothetical protein
MFREDSHQEMMCNYLTSILCVALILLAYDVYFVRHQPDVARPTNERLQ